MRFDYCSRLYELVDSPINRALLVDIYVAVDWLVSKMGLRAAPFKLLGKAWGTVASWVGGDDDSDTSTNTKKKPLAKALLGSALAAQPAMALHDETVEASP